MPLFEYKAKRRNAETIFGKINAANKEDAVEKLTRMELVPVTLEEHKDQNVNQVIVRPGRVRSRDLFHFNRQLAILLKSGISILRALEILVDQNRNSAVRGLVASIRASIQGGKSFSEAISDFPKIFPSLHVVLIRAGEEGGNLKEALQDIAEHQRRQEEFASKVRMAFAYPLLMLLFGAGTIIFILTYVMPQITSLFENLKQTLPWQTIVVMKASRFLISQGYVLLAGAALAGLFLARWIKTPAGQKVISEVVVRIPFLGGFLLKAELARFFRTLHVLLKSGIPIIRSLQLAVPVVNNSVLQAQLVKCRDDLVAGGSLGMSLRQSPLVPVMAGHVISVGEESGSLAASLQDIIEGLEQEIEETVKILTTMLEPLMIVGVGSVIGFIVIAMLLPIFQLDIMAG